MRAIVRRVAWVIIFWACFLKLHAEEMLLNPDYCTSVGLFYGQENTAGELRDEFRELFFGDPEYQKTSAVRTAGGIDTRIPVSSFLTFGGEFGMVSYINKTETRTIQRYNGTSWRVYARFYFGAHGEYQP